MFLNILYIFKEYKNLKFLNRNFKNKINMNINKVNMLYFYF